LPCCSRNIERNVARCSRTTTCSTVFSGSRRSYAYGAACAPLGLAGLVAAILCGAFVDVATTPQPPHRAVADALSHVTYFVLRRRRGLVKAHAAVVGLLEDAVDAERVEVWMNSA
jgi:hypothetical protein